MIGFYNYTVILTYFGLLSSVIGMYYALCGNIPAAISCLLISGGCDMFDGKIARTKKNRTDEEKSFGIQIDSLCDVVCFGVFPSVIAFSLGCTRPWQLAVAALFTLCGLIRLAYYNVTEQIRQNTTDAKRDAYLGLPITASAFFVPLMMCFKAVLGASLPIAMSVLQLVLGICYIAPVRIKKPGMLAMAIMIALGFVMLYVLFAG